MSGLLKKTARACSVRRKDLLVSTALLASAVAGATPMIAQADTGSDALIVYYNDYNGIQTNLAAAQTAAGNTATITTPATTVDLSTYTQVWDLGYNTALTDAQITYYTNYLQNGGTLFLLGENAGFITRDNSITALISALGGGTVSVSTSSNSAATQTVDSSIQIANQTSTVTFAAIGQFASVGTGTCITSDCGAAAWGVGTLSGASTGTIISVLDVNFLDSYYLQSDFVANLISYLAQQAELGSPQLPNIVTTDGSSTVGQVGTSVAPRFDGGTLTADQSSSANFTVTGNGGTLDAKGNTATFSGVFSDDSATPSGSIQITDTTGGGAIVLTGANTFTGGFTVNPGAHLSISDAASLGSGTLNLVGTATTPAYFDVTGDTTIANAITVSGDPVFDIASGTTTTITGAISDGASAGDVVKQGDGTLTLAGANSYSGGTVVSAGTLALSGSGTLGATTGTTTVNGGTLDLGGTTQTQSSVSLTGGTIQNGTLSSAGTFDLQSGTVDATLTGTGALIKSTSGTVTLSQANSYTGATTIAGGTLALTGAGSIAGSAVTDNGTLDISGANGNSTIANLNGSGTVALGAKTLTVSNGSGTFAGSLGGTGGFTLGGGALTLTGANSYTGATTIASGATLTGSSTSLSGGTIVDNGTLTVNQSANGTLAQAISGSGMLVKTGTGTLTLTGANSYTGGTAVGAGTLKGDTTSLQGTILDNATVEFAQANDGTYGGTLAGTGGLVKSGSGALTLSGTDTLSGSTLVSAGRLAVNGTLTTAALTVNNGATLGGSGTINGAVSVLSGATLAPGNSPGTLTVNGAVTMASGSTLALDIDGRTYAATGGTGSYDRLTVNGTFTAAGTLTTTLRGITGSASNSFTPVLGDRFTVVTASAISGTFSAITQPTSGLADNTRFDALYGTTSIQLVVTPGSFAKLGTAQGWNKDTLAIATALDGVRDVTSNTSLFNRLYGLDAAGYGVSFSQLSGQIHAHALQNFADVASGTLGVVRGNATTPSNGGKALWGSYLNISQSPAGDSIANGYAAHNDGFVMGLTVLNHDHVRFGIAGSYSRNKITTGIGSSALGNSASGYAYGYWAPVSRFDLTAVAGFTKATINTSRTTATTTGDVGAAATDHVFAAQMAVDARLMVARAGGLSLYAVAGLEGASTDAGQVRETADSAAFALSLPSDQWQTLQSRLGGQVEQKLPFGAFNAYASWTRQLADLPTASRLVALAGTSWTVQSVGVNRSGVTYGGAFSAHLAKALTVRVQYDRADSGKGQRSDRASAGVSLAF